MSTEVIVAIITSVCSLLGVIITVIWGTKKNGKKTDEYKNLTCYRIEQLEKKVEKHNNVVERTYKLEGEVGELKHEMKTVRNYLVNSND